MSQRTVRRPIRVGVLVDLHWSPNAGGHVKTWERLAAATAALNDGVDAEVGKNGQNGEDGQNAEDGHNGIDLTVHFLGRQDAIQVIGPSVRYQIHRPLLSTANLPFLSHIPDHTDLAPHNPRLAARLRGYDLIHTTDGTFASARTAARVARRHGIPLCNSVHTTIPVYTRVFTDATVERIAGAGRLAGLLLDRWNVAGWAEARMQERLDGHLRACSFVLASRADDRLRLAALLGPERVGLLRRGIDHRLFDPGRRDRRWLERTLGVPTDRRVVITVGRLDRIKNVLLLGRAIRLLVGRGFPVHLLCPGKGPARDALRELLGDRVTCPGVLEPDALARAYASSDVCAQPALIEELSNAVLEAGSSGLPLLVAASSGSGRFLLEGETGTVVQGSEPEDWADALARLLEDPGRLVGMGRSARRWSLAHVPTWRQVLLEDLLPTWRRASGRLERGDDGAARASHDIVSCAAPVPP